MPTSKIDRIQALVDQGILDRENCPELAYWRWTILKSDELPEEFAHFKKLGEVRWYGEE